MNRLIKDGPELLIALATIVALTILVMLPMGIIMHGRAQGFWSEMAIGVIYAAICGLGFWLSWGGSRVLFRLVVVGAGALFLCVALEAFSGLRNLFVDFTIVTLGTAMVIALPRVVGVRQCRIGPDGSPQVSSKGGQFSLLDLFVWTTTVAVLVAFIRWGGTQQHSRMDELQWLSGVFGVSTLLAMWATLTMNDRVVRRGAIAAAITLVISFFVFDGVETVGTLVAVAIMMGCFLVMRKLGVRLVWGKSVRPPAAGEPTADSERGDALDAKR